MKSGDLKALMKVNPWTLLPAEAPYVLREDRHDLEARHSKFKTAGDLDRYGCQLQCLPDPYCGRLNASVILYTLNPGYTPPNPASPESRLNDDWWFANSQELRDAYARNYHQEPLEYPLFHLDPRFERSPGGIYWNKALREVLRHCDRKTVASNLLIVDSFPYHSCNYPKSPWRIFSQNFTWALMRAAVDRNATILILRNRTQLLDNVLSLRDYPFIRVISEQGGAITPGNMPEWPRFMKPYAM